MSPQTNVGGDAQRPDQPTPAGSGDGDRADGDRNCPLCPFAGDDRAAVYVHLQTRHRKSVISDALLDRNAD